MPACSYPWLHSYCQTIVVTVVVMNVASHGATLDGGKRASIRVDAQGKMQGARRFPFRKGSDAVENGRLTRLTQVDEKARKDNSRKSANDV